MTTTDVQILGKEYTDECVRIALLNKKIGGTRVLSAEKYQQLLTKSDNIIRIGYFENEKLVSWVSIGFYESKMRGKFWAITELFTTVFKERFSFSRPEFGLIFKRAFEIAEERGYFQYFYCIAERLERVYERQWRKNPWGFNGRYELITLDVVPANTKPEFELYWRLMGQELKSDNIVIKSRRLKNHESFIDIKND
jgi:hypothetical protein